MTQIRAVNDGACRQNRQRQRRLVHNVSIDIRPVLRRQLADGAAFAAFMAPLQQEFGWRIPDIAIGASIISIMIMILSPIQGALVDKYGSRPLLLISIPIFAASLAAMYFLPNNLTVFYAAWVVISICGSAAGRSPICRPPPAGSTRTSAWHLVSPTPASAGAAPTPLIVGALISACGARGLRRARHSRSAGLAGGLFLSAEPARGRCGGDRRGQDFWEAAKTRPLRSRSGLSSCSASSAAR